MTAIWGQRPHRGSKFRKLPLLITFWPLGVVDPKLGSWKPLNQVLCSFWRGVYGNLADNLNRWTHLNCWLLVWLQSQTCLPGLFSKQFLMNRTSLLYQSLYASVWNFIPGNRLGIYDPPIRGGVDSMTPSISGGVESMTAPYQRGFGIYNPPWW